MYAAVRVSDGKDVALKFFGYAEQKPIHSSINNEILLLMALRGCEGATQIQGIFYDKAGGMLPDKKFGKTEAYPVIVMERCSGSDLFDTIKAAFQDHGHPSSGRSTFTYAHLADLFRRSIIAVKSLHERGFIHRDLKLENLMTLTADYNSPVKVIDFGSMISERGDTEVYSGTWAGTPRLYAPESCYRRKYSFKSDIWQMGMALYTMLYADYPSPHFVNMNEHQCASLHELSTEAYERLLFPDTANWRAIPEDGKVDLISTF